MSFWINYRMYYGESPVREVYGGDVVIINEDLHDAMSLTNSKANSSLTFAQHWMVRAV